MAASGKLTLRFNPDQAHQAERIAQQQLFGVEKTSSQLLMTVASRLHERLAASVSVKLTNFDASDHRSVRLLLTEGRARAHRTCSSFGRLFSPRSSSLPLIFRMHCVRRAAYCPLTRRVELLVAPEASKLGNKPSLRFSARKNGEKKTK